MLKLRFNRNSNLSLQMKSFIYMCLLLCTISGYGQTLSKIKILYESKDVVVLNSGQKYQIIKETPLYAITDVTIPIKYELDGKTLVLNRVLLVKSRKEKENKKLIEWIKGKLIFYELRSTSSIQ